MKANKFIVTVLSAAALIAASACRSTSGTKTTTSRTEAVVRSDAFGVLGEPYTQQVWVFENTGQSTYNALDLSIEKRYANNWSGRISYSLSKSTGTGNDQADKNLYQVGTNLNLDAWRGPSNVDRRLRASSATRRPAVKIVHVTNVDFSLRQFVLPLMRGARARGHEVAGVCADGPLLAQIRAEGFRVIPVPMARCLPGLRKSKIAARGQAEGARRCPYGTRKRRSVLAKFCCGGAG